MGETTDLDTFLASLSADAPPAGGSPALTGVWHALRGDWDAAHDAANAAGADCAWVHAALHREEGDQANADYWYRRAGRARASGDSAAEYRAIAVALLVRS